LARPLLRLARHGLLADVRRLGLPFFAGGEPRENVGRFLLVRSLVAVASITLRAHASAAASPDRAGVGVLTFLEEEVPGCGRRLVGLVRRVVDGKEGVQVRGVGRRINGEVVVAGRNVDLETHDRRALEELHHAIAADELAFQKRFGGKSEDQS
jgi:hypothetical protein